MYKKYPRTVHLPWSEGMSADDKICKNTQHFEGNVLNPLNLSMTEKLQQVIVIRKDLSMRKGKMIAQGAHACLASILENQQNERVQVWLSESFTKVCVYVNSEEELLKTYNKAKDAKFICSIIKDSGLTEFNGVPTFTCCAIGPATKEELQNITGHLKLL
jgi:PTH2 family peptidyl-tRNA hydrolase